MKIFVVRFTMKHTFWNLAQKFMKIYSGFLIQKKRYKFVVFSATAVYLSLFICLPAFASSAQGNHTSILSNQIIVMGLLLLLGFAGGKIVQFINLPSVTGYVLIGILLGASAIDIIRNHMLESLNFIEALGLCMVALIIGGDLHIKKLKDLGKMVVILTIVQVMVTFVFVSLLTGLLLGIPWPIALILGAISSATAPAATVAVIHECKARGPLTDTLMAVVALDDAVCIILFSIAAAAAKVMIGSGVISVRHFVLPLWDIGGSFLLGGILGIVTIKLMKWIKERSELLIVIFGFSFLFGEIARQLHLSALLTNMMYGFVLVNFSSNRRVLHVLTDIELPIFVCFFTLAGASLNLKILLENWLPAMIFVIARASGKLSGSYIGGVLGKSPDLIKKYLGFGMLPQAGVAIALVLAVQSEFPGISSVITAIVLAAVAVNEIVGPLGTKFALTKAGETNRIDHSDFASQ
ncbi:cation:proton antiporter [bacterium]|nr:cation:proton antiporter [bacterium]